MPHIWPALPGVAASVGEGSRPQLFGLRKELPDADLFDGHVLDPVANVNAAVSLWLATCGWEQFGCAAGADAGLKAGPVLPQCGGPELPVWATSY